MSKGTRSILLIVLALCVIGVTLLVIIKNKNKTDTGSSKEMMKTEESSVISETSDSAEETSVGTSKMTFIGHASVKIVTSAGTVIYIDPYYSGDYSQAADIILVTHGHDDHNNTSLCTENDGCQIIKWSDALVDGEYKTVEKDDVKIEAVPSGGNSNHDSAVCVGYIVTVDGVNVYHAGDTSMYDGLKEIADKQIDYAMYPIDGVYNMDVNEAMEVSDMIGAAHNIPIHGTDAIFSKQKENFTAKGALLLEPGDTIELIK